MKFKSKKLKYGDRIRRAITSEKESEGTFWRLEMFHVLFWMVVTQACTFVKIQHALPLWVLCYIYIEYIYNILCVCVRAQPCPTLCDPRDYSLPGSSVHGIFQAKNTGLPFPAPGNLPDPGIEPASPEAPALASRFFTIDTELSGKPICICVFPQFKNFNLKVLQTAEELS